MTNWTTTQAALTWGISRRRVQQLLLAGRVPGAYWIGRDWLIPAETRKPIELPPGRKTGDSNASSSCR